MDVLKALKDLDLSENPQVKWEDFRENFENMLLASGLDSATEEKKIGLFLNQIGDEARDFTIKYYLKAGAEKHKLVLGIPTYGRSYTLIDEENTDIGAPSDGPGEQGDATREKGYLAYYEICQNLKNDNDWTLVHTNSRSMGPYAFRKNQWVGFDDEKMVRKKAEYVVDKGLGGIMFWSIDNDDFRGNCNGRPYPLIEAAKETMLHKSGENVNEVVKKDKSKKPGRSRSQTNYQIRNKISESNIETSNQTTTMKTLSKKINVSTTTSSTFENTKAGSSLKKLTPQPPTTPDPGVDFKCEEEGFFPHPRDCKKYYWCLDSGPSNLGVIAHQFTCPSGLYFNTAADSCDFTRNVLCKQNNKVTTTKATTVSNKLKSMTTKTITSPKIIGNIIQTTKLTTLSPEDEEYENEYDDENLKDVKEELLVKDSEEDPKLIKELIILIKKAGGIEELEKLLKLDEQEADGENQSFKNAKVIEKQKKIISLKDRFSSLQALNKNTKSLHPTTEKEEDRDISEYSSVVLNGRSRPQNDGLQKLVELEGFLRKKPKYVTLNRSRPTEQIGTHKNYDKTDEEHEFNYKNLKNKDAEIGSVFDFETTNKNILTSTLSYFNIRRNLPLTGIFKSEISTTDPSIEINTTENSYKEQNSNLFIKKRYKTIARPVVQQTFNESKILEGKTTQVTVINTENNVSTQTRKRILVPYFIADRGTTTSATQKDQQSDQQEATPEPFTQHTNIKSIISQTNIINSTIIPEPISETTSRILNPTKKIKHFTTSQKTIDSTEMPQIVNTTGTINNQFIEKITEKIHGDNLLHLPKHNENYRTINSKLNNLTAIANSVQSLDKSNHSYFNLTMSVNGTSSFTKTNESDLNDQNTTEIFGTILRTFSPNYTTSPLTAQRNPSSNSSLPNDLQLFNVSDVNINIKNKDVETNKVSPVKQNYLIESSREEINNLGSNNGSSINKSRPITVNKTESRLYFNGKTNKTFNLVAVLEVGSSKGYNDSYQDIGDLSTTNNVESNISKNYFKSSTNKFNNSKTFSRKLIFSPKKENFLNQDKKVEITDSEKIVDSSGSLTINQITIPFNSIPKQVATNLNNISSHSTYFYNKDVQNYNTTKAPSLRKKCIKKLTERFSNNSKKALLEPNENAKTYSWRDARTGNFRPWKTTTSNPFKADLSDVDTFKVKFMFDNCSFEDTFIQSSNIEEYKEKKRTEGLTKNLNSTNTRGRIGTYGLSLNNIGLLGNNIIHDLSNNNETLQIEKNKKPTEREQFDDTNPESNNISLIYKHNKVNNTNLSSAIKNESISLNNNRNNSRKKQLVNGENIIMKRILQEKKKSFFKEFNDTDITTVLNQQNTQEFNKIRTPTIETLVERKLNIENSANKSSIKNRIPQTLMDKLINATNNPPFKSDEKMNNKQKSYTINQESISIANDFAIDKTDNQTFGHNPWSRVLKYKKNIKLFKNKNEIIKTNQSSERFLKENNIVNLSQDLEVTTMNDLINATFENKTIKNSPAFQVRKVLIKQINNIETSTIRSESNKESYSEINQIEHFDSKEEVHKTEPPHSFDKEPLIIENESLFKNKDRQINQDNAGHQYRKIFIKYKRRMGTNKNSTDVINYINVKEMNKTTSEDNKKIINGKNLKKLQKFSEIEKLNSSSGEETELLKSKFFKQHEIERNSTNIFHVKNKASQKNVYGTIENENMTISTKNPDRKYRPKLTTDELSSLLAVDLTNDKNRKNQNPIPKVVLRRRRPIKQTKLLNNSLSIDMKQMFLESFMFETKDKYKNVETSYNKFKNDSEDANNNYYIKSYNETQRKNSERENNKQNENDNLKISEALDILQTNDSEKHLEDREELISTTEKNSSLLDIQQSRPKTFRYKSLDKYENEEINSNKLKNENNNMDKNVSNTSFGNNGNIDADKKKNISTNYLAGIDSILHNDLSKINKYGRKKNISAINETSNQNNTLVGNNQNEYDETNNNNIIKIQPILTTFKKGLKNNLDIQNNDKLVTSFNQLNQYKHKKNSVPNNSKETEEIEIKNRSDKGNNIKEKYNHEFIKGKPFNRTETNNYENKFRQRIRSNFTTVEIMKEDYPNTEKIRKYNFSSISSLLNDTYNFINSENKNASYEFENKLNMKNMVHKATEMEEKIDYENEDENYSDNDRDDYEETDNNNKENNRDYDIKKTEVENYGKHVNSHNNKEEKETASENEMFNSRSIGENISLKQHIKEQSADIKSFIKVNSTLINVNTSTREPITNLNHFKSLEKHLQSNSKSNNTFNENTTNLKLNRICQNNNSSFCVGSNYTFKPQFSSILKTDAIGNDVNNKIFLLNKNRRFQNHNKTANIDAKLNQEFESTSRYGNVRRFRVLKLKQPVTTTNTDGLILNSKLTENIKTDVIYDITKSPIRKKVIIRKKPLTTITNDTAILRKINTNNGSEKTTRINQNRGFKFVKKFFRKNDTLARKEIENIFQTLEFDKDMGIHFPEKPNITNLIEKSYSDRSSFKQTKPIPSLTLTTRKYKNFAQSKSIENASFSNIIGNISIFKKPYTDIQRGNPTIKLIAEKTEKPNSSTPIYQKNQSNRGPSNFQLNIEEQIKEDINENKQNEFNHTNNNNEDNYDIDDNDGDDDDKTNDNDNDYDENYEYDNNEQNKDFLYDDNGESSDMDKKSDNFLNKNTKVESNKTEISTSLDFSNTFNSYSNINCNQTNELKRCKSKQNIPIDINKNLSTKRYYNRYRANNPNNILKNRTFSITSSFPISNQLSLTTNFPLTTPSIFKSTNTKLRKYTTPISTTENTLKDDLLSDINVNALNARNKKIFEITSKKHTVKPKSKAQINNFKTDRITSNANETTKTDILENSSKPEIFYFNNDFNNLQENTIEKSVHELIKSTEKPIEALDQVTTNLNEFLFGDIKISSTMEDISNTDIDLTTIDTKEKLVEISRVVEISSKENKLKPKSIGIILNNYKTTAVTLIEPPHIDKLGEISRVKFVSLVKDEKESSSSELYNETNENNKNYDDNTSHETEKKGREFIFPEVLRGIETSTIPLEGLFKMYKKFKANNMEKNSPVYASSLGETDGTPKSSKIDVKLFGNQNNNEYNQNIQTTTLKIPSEKTTVSADKQTNYIHPIIPLLRPESNESSPLVISIANLDKVILSKVLKPDSSLASSIFFQTYIQPPNQIENTNIFENNYNIINETDISNSSQNSLTQNKNHFSEQTVVSYSDETHTEHKTIKIPKNQKKTENSKTQKIL